MEKLFSRLVAAYLCVAILVFGYSFNNDYRVEGPLDAGVNVVRAFGCAGFWPLYLSVQVFKCLRP